ncbi:tRNA pseudouridine synthase A [Nasonia vitripennis]|uniref:tRNA pseudouridine synthase n=1 Tax=Nasonia vitripennis TaxID=7425 RepID=A0A7M7G9A3_NASVI|nr:tRNA pseudouridine synthase A [Nasonia vitripennis]
MSNISRRYLLKLSYIGTSYRGSQKHVNNAVVDIDTIQGAIEYSMRRFNFSNIPTISLAGRTDAGVHALCTSAHVDLEHSGTLDTEYLVRMMNRNLINANHEIRIMSAHEVSKDFHARYSAKSRTYLYRLIIPKDPLDHRFPIAEANRSLFLNMYPQNFDIERLRSGIKLFCGTKDFMTFSARKRDRNPEFEMRRNFVRTLHVTMKEAGPLMSFDPLSKNLDYWHLEFTSRSFLYNQIRRIVGSLIALGSHKVSEEDIQTMIQVPSHHNWNPHVTPAAPRGLYLKNVEYDEEITREICS